MENQQSVPRQTSRSARAVSAVSEQLYALPVSMQILLIQDWRMRKYVLYAALLLLVNSLVVVAYYVNYPQVELQPDTPSYLYVVRHILTQGQIVDGWRLPGYPLFIVLIYMFAGRGNLAAVSLAQGVLFVLTALELYVVAVLILKRGWAALLIGLLVGTNIVLLSYVKPVLSEGLATWLLMSLVLAVVCFVRTQRVREFWLVAVCMLALFMTRPEWMYLPLPLVAYLLLTTRGRYSLRHVWPHMLTALVLLYAILGGYIVANSVENQVVGATAIQNMNMLGKVLQYHMQDEAPARYAGISRTLDTYVHRGQTDPYPILSHEPLLARNHARLAGEFAQTIIEHHLLEFLAKSVPLIFSSLTNYHTSYRIPRVGPLQAQLKQLKAVFSYLYGWNSFYPRCVELWLLLLCWPRTRRMHMVQMMGAVVLISFYGLLVTTLGAYSGFDYMRIHILFDPLLMLVIWGSMLAGAFLLTVSGLSLFNYCYLRAKRE